MQHRFVAKAGFGAAELTVTSLYLLLVVLPVTLETNQKASFLTPFVPLDAVTPLRSRRKPTAMIGMSSMQRRFVVEVDLGGAGPKAKNSFPLLVKWVTPCLSLGTNQKMSFSTPYVRRENQDLSILNPHGGPPSRTPSRGSDLSGAGNASSPHSMDRNVLGVPKHVFGGSRSVKESDPILNIDVIAMRGSGNAVTTFWPAQYFETTHGDAMSTFGGLAGFAVDETRQYHTLIVLVL